MSTTSFTTTDRTLTTTASTEETRETDKLSDTVETTSSGRDIIVSRDDKDKE